MASANATLFKNVTNLGRKKRRIIDVGAVHSVNHDGLIIARARRRGLNFPVKGLLMIVCVVVGFKVLALQSIGERQYAERQAVLENGTSAEKVGAYVMQIDPITAFVQDQLSKALR